ncbi:MAG: hypothetical protein JWO41_606 [Candidatus Saccharibacteria bacterium]|nr:hypothetical protein [Candidatus Saccharibacteria bacterium]
MSTNFNNVPIPRDEADLEELGSVADLMGSVISLTFVNPNPERIRHPGHRFDLRPDEDIFAGSQEDN